MDFLHRHWEATKCSGVGEPGCSLESRTVIPAPSSLYMMDGANWRKTSKGKVVRDSLGWGQLQWREKGGNKGGKTVRFQWLPELGCKRLEEVLNLGKERMVGGDEWDSEHNDFKFAVWDLQEPSRQLDMWLGERLDKGLGVSHREVRVEAVEWDHQGKTTREWDRRKAQRKPKMEREKKCSARLASAREML